MVRLGTERISIQTIAFPMSFIGSGVGNAPVSRDTAHPVSIANNTPRK